MAYTNLKRRAIKQQIIQKNKMHTTDTGSTTLQLSLLTHKIQMLQKHQTLHPKDITIKKAICCLKSKIAKFKKYLNNK